MLSNAMLSNIDFSLNNLLNYHAGKLVSLNKGDLSSAMM